MPTRAIRSIAEGDVLTVAVPDITAAVRRQLIDLKRILEDNFTHVHWSELAALTGTEDLINDHPRLLRALSFGDEDYAPLILPTLIKIVARDPASLPVIEQYVVDTFNVGGETISTAPSKARRIVFSPSVFEVPDEGVNTTLVAVMMPFAPEFEPVYAAIGTACKRADLECVRVKDMWDHSTIIQDVFGLIFRASVVVCDFTGKNPNVFYEAGIAHTLGKHVVPLSQSADDIPFDVAHHRYLKYLNNGEGRAEMASALAQRLRVLAPQPDLF